MSKRTIHIESGGGKFIRVENRPKSGCAQRAQMIQEMITWVKMRIPKEKILGGGGGGGGGGEGDDRWSKGDSGFQKMRKPVAMSYADVVECPSFTQILLYTLYRMLGILARDPKKKAMLKNMGINVDALPREPLYNSSVATTIPKPPTKIVKDRAYYAGELFRAVGALTLLSGAAPELAEKVPWLIIFAMKGL